MSKQRKYSYEEKVRACEDYFSGKRSPSQIANDFGLSKISGGIRHWFRSYQNGGAKALLPKSKTPVYKKEFKMLVVEEYLEGKGSLGSLTAKYNISSIETLRRWILRYNSHMEFKDYDPKQEVYMAEARRKTTKDERIEIVTYCVAHNHSYKGTAERYGVSYSQVYSWVKKYKSQGEDGLNDKRGRHKSDEEVDELEKLRRENKRLKRQLEEREMTVELLKKVKELEGRRYSPKEN